MTINPATPASSPHSGTDALGTQTRRTTRRELNVPLLVASVVVVVVLGGSAYLWRNHQVTALADSLLDRVDQLENEEKWGAAVGYLQQYLALKPDEDQIHVRAAKVFDHDLQSRRQRYQAAQLYYRAVGVSPQDATLRRRLAVLLFDSGQTTAAVVEAKKLLEVEDGDGGAGHIDATAQRIVALVAADESQSRDSAESWNQARNELEKANKAQPSDVDVARGLALIYRTRADKLGIPSDEAARLADQVIEKMVAAAPDRADSYVTRSQYRQMFALAGVRDDIEQALKLDPKDPKVLVTSGQYFLAAAPPEGDVARARELCQQLVDVAPTMEAGYLLLGRAQKALGSTEDAVATWELGRRRLAEFSNALNVELFETQLAARKLQPAQQVLKLLKEHADEVLVYESTDVRIRTRFTLARLEAQWLLANNEPGRVVPLLESAIATSGSLGSSARQNPELGRCRVLLAQAYAALESWDLAAAEYSELSSSSTAPWEIALLTGEAWKRAGDYDRAIAQYQRAAEHAKAPPQVWLGLGQAQLERQIRTPGAENRDWQPFLKTLSVAKQALPTSSAVRWLEVGYLLAQGNDADRNRAEALLRAGEKQHADEKEYWQRLIVAYERLNHPADADRALRKFVGLEQNAVETAVSRVNLMAMRKQFAEAEKILAQAIADSPMQLRKALLYRQMQLALEAGDLAVGRKRLAALLADDPTNLRILRRSAELAFDARDWKELARLDEPLRKAEGESGHAWRFYRAAHMLADPARRSPKDIAEAEQLVAAILKDRPRWAPATVLSGQIAEARGDTSHAIASYTSAIEAGDRRIATYERLIGLLYRLNRFAEAQQVLDEMGRGAFSSERLESLALAVAVQQDQRERAVELARESVAERPNDAMRHIWLAEMLQLNEKRPEAIATLQKAVQLAPQDVRPWNAVFMYHLRGRDAAKAEKTLTEMTKQVPLEPAQKAFVLAQGYELLGKRPEALTNYRQASELAPKDAAILSRLAALQLHDDVDAAEQTLRKIVAIAPDNVRARQALATLLALRDGDGAWDEAQELLRQATTDGTPLPADDRLRAVLLVRRGGDKQQRIAQHAEARMILEGRVNGNESPAAADRLLLAGVYESEARLLADRVKLKAARDQLWTLADVAEPSESHLGLCADFALRHSRDDGSDSLVPAGSEIRAQLLKDALTCVDKIEALQRKAQVYPTSRALALRVRLMQLQDRDKQIESFVEPLADERLESLAKDAEKDQWMLDVGNLYMSVALHEPAERWYRRLWPRVSRAYVPLVQCLASQGRFDEVVTVCDAAAKADTSSPRPVQVLASVLASGKPTADDLARAEPIIAQTLKANPSDAELWFSAAVLRTIHGRPEEAIELFEAVVKLSPKHLLALNNLATLLAEQPERRQDALRYVEQAIAVAGRKPALLDTQGTIHLMAGDLKAAVKCLEEAVNSEAVDPRYPFHLAAAYAKSGRLEDARSAFEKAKQTGLEEQVLTAGDLAFKSMLEKSL
ncbi:MAG: tetratricopeptide repeat protein [Pirellulales bacterium]